jgi:hypothetical protein
MMASSLVLPGVQVRVRFEPSPVPSGATGILGVVGVTDRGPLDPTPVGTFTEFLDNFGPGSSFTMPEVRSALTNGVAQVVVSRIAPGRGQKAFLELLDDDGEKVARLEARAEGAWGERITVRVIPVKTLSGLGTKYVNLELSYGGEVVERLDNLVMDSSSPNYLFDRVNEGSRLVTAVDPLFEKALPAPITNTALADADSRPAFALLTKGATNVVKAEAKRAGRAGNRLAIDIDDGHAGLVLSDGGNPPKPSVDIRARTRGAAGTTIQIAVTTAGPPGSKVLTGAGGPVTFDSVASLVSQLATNPMVEAVAIGDEPPMPADLGTTALKRRVDLTVFAEGRDPRRYEGLADVASIVALKDTLIEFTAIAGATDLPDANAGIALSGGRDRGAALELRADPADPPLLELTTAPNVTVPLEVKLTSGTSSVDGATPVANLEVFADGEVVETFTDLTMDPDDPGYLPEVLQSSAFVRGVDLFVPSRTTSLPAAVVRPRKLTGGMAVSADDYQSALDRLEQAEAVDLVIASVANQLGDSEIRTVQQQVVAHCTNMADLARNRIGLGSITASEDGNVGAILDHADDVRSNHFILCVPAGSEGAIAGLLGRQQFFESPTFKTIAALGVAPGRYTDAQLTQLVGGNVTVVNQRRGLGVIVIKGLLTSGRQINVQRTADKAVRDVAAIARVYIGLLNNEGARNALRQQVFAMLLQMERDGALVPSTDGSSPAFTVDVHSSQADFANGIVRVDIALRPVRAIDNILASILVQN